VVFRKVAFYENRKTIISLRLIKEVKSKSIKINRFYEDGSDRVFRNFSASISDAGESPKRRNTRFRTRRKPEIKNIPVVDLVT
jgi:hypothetical protein